MYIATIDTGTTNTRVKLWQEGKVLTSSHVGVGVRDTGITDSKDKLKKGVKDAIDLALNKANLTHHDIELYLASGMITSNVGLFEVPHVFAPAGVAELAEQMVSATIKEVLDQPIWFVPGVKNNIQEITVENCEAMDIMRGEEVETIGLLDHLNISGPALLVLPGSHSKFVRVDRSSRITGSMTTLAGELLSVLTTDTILASSLEKSFAKNLDPEMALRGAEYARKYGLTRTCFTVRLLDQFTDSSLNGKANFLAGAIVSTDLLVVKNSSAMGDCRELPVIMGGSNIMSGIFETLIHQDDYFNGDLITVDSDIMKDKAGYGAILVARSRGLCT